MIKERQSSGKYHQTNCRKRVSDGLLLHVCCVTHSWSQRSLQCEVLFRVLFASERKATLTTLAWGKKRENSRVKETRVNILLFGLWINPGCLYIPLKSRPLSRPSHSPLTHLFWPKLNDPFISCRGCRALRWWSAQWLCVHVKFTAHPPSYPLS